MEGVGACMGVGTCAACGGGESVGRTLLSSSHVDVVNSSKCHFCGRGVGVEGALGGNNTVKYCWMTNCSFLPVWKAWSPSCRAVPVMTTQSTSRPSKV